MNKAWGIVGRIAYFIVWPGLYLILNNTQRTRVIVTHEGKILMVKDWLGDGTWKLPGGGVHKNETAVNSAIRELKEETGIIVTDKQLKPKGEVKTTSHLIKNKLAVYSYTLSANIPIHKHKTEILMVEWVDVKNLQQMKLSKNTKTVLNKFGPSL